MKSFKDFLLEMFDKPWHYEKDVVLSDRYKKQMHKDPTWNGHSITNVNVHKIEGDNGYLTSYVRNGLLEVHHNDVDGESGKLHKNTEKPNPKFYSTIIHHYKKYGLNKGRQVRVSAEKDSDLDEHYTSLVSKLAKKHRYEIEHGEEHLNNGIHLHTMIISPPEHPMTHGLRELIEARNIELKLKGEENGSN